ncbi:hypothetical protein ONE63_001666 [Megalurothrips usitatus]|uniref:Carboxylesterase type B domain-containing protein n=1 Tax=Megalurothrips usitatus TaxID=439358 RepID=A0AAV7XC64_9NEOP|nr:hypothetical protein ONE63_001666 [Megalurothrips usitatus]
MHDYVWDCLNVCSPANGGYNIPVPRRVSVADLTGRSRTYWICGRCSDGQVVTLSTGKVRGERVSGAGCARDYWAFRGIRYAASPVGELRFKAPRPAASWEGVADATVEGSPCPQVQDGVVIGCEDCLNLNVYTPTLDCPAGGYAVIVFFHGGYFVWGDIGPTPVFGPDFLVNEDVVLILPNYRLGALGFLNLNTPAVPGNAGIKDGVEALRWVRANAAAFCGDSARVTIMGQSAGAKMAAFLSLTEAARGRSGRRGRRQNNTSKSCVREISGNLNSTLLPSRPSRFATAV